MEMKRLFVGMQAVAPWPETFPNGRVLLEVDRHLTLAFLGDCNLSSVIDSFQRFPNPGFQIGLAALFDHPVFLPHREPKTAGWHVRLLEKNSQFSDFCHRVWQWLREIQADFEEPKEFLTHVTVARQPFVIREWKQSFQPLPLFLKNIYLCESLGFSRYDVQWSHEILSPFEVIEHTADVAFIIRGQTFDDLFIHAALALAFQFPPLMNYLQETVVHGMDELIYQLNHLIARTDAAEGCPFKAVSYHCSMENRENILEWEMIVDV